MKPATGRMLELWLEVDGHRFQNGSTRTMVFGVPFLVSYLSRYMSLQSGDVILTGTPPVWVSARSRRSTFVPARRCGWAFRGSANSISASSPEPGAILPYNRGSRCAALSRLIVVDVPAANGRIQ